MLKYWRIDSDHEQKCQHMHHGDGQSGRRSFHRCRINRRDRRSEGGSIEGHGDIASNLGVAVITGS